MSSGNNESNTPKTPTENTLPQTQVPKNEPNTIPLTPKKDNNPYRDTRFIKLANSVDNKK